MSLVIKISLLALVFWLISPVAMAQRTGGTKGRPAPKSKEAETNESQREAAELFESGQNAHQAGDLTKAIELYSEALKRDQSLWQAEFQLGIAYLSLNRYQEAKRSLLHADELLTQFEDSPELHQA